MKIYFAGSIRGGRLDQPVYFKVIEHLKRSAIVLTEHISNDQLTMLGEDQQTDQWIYERDLSWLEEADLLIAEVTNPSLGVGYEIAKAESMGKPVICLFRESGDRSLSAMISGNRNFEIIRYSEMEEALNRLDTCLTKVFKTEKNL